MLWLMEQTNLIDNRQLGRNRFVVFLVLLVAAGLVLEPRLGIARAILAAFDLAALMFLLSCIRLFLLPEDQIRDAATVNDPTRVPRLALGLVLVIVIFAAITALILDRSVLQLPEKLLIAASLVLVWTFANTLYTLHYAHLYYSSDPGGGLLFPGGGHPDIADFAYFAFTIGVAVQTADVGISSPAIRRVVTMHAILGFFFNIGVLALTINVLGSN